MSLPFEIWLEIFDFLRYEEMVKMGFEGPILVMIFKRQFRHNSLMEYIQPNKQFYIPKNMMEIMRNKVNNFFEYCNFIIEGKFVKLKKVDWRQLSWNKCLTKEIIDTYSEKWNWNILSGNEYITGTFFCQVYN